MYTVIIILILFNAKLDAEKKVVLNCMLLGLRDSIMLDIFLNLLSFFRFTSSCFILREVSKI